MIVRSHYVAYGVSGLGDDDTTDPIYVSTGSSSSGVYDPTTGLNTDGIYQEPATSSSSSGSASSGASVNVAQDISAIGTTFANIFKAINPLPSGCTQVAGPYGVSTQCLAQGQASTLSLSNLTSSLGGSSSLLLIGGVVLVVMLMSKH